jgi:hypothetical protein
MASLNTFVVRQDETTLTQAIIEWKIPEYIVFKDIISIHVRLFKDGKWENVEQLNQAGKGKRVYDAEITCKGSPKPPTSFTFSGLKPATVYRARLKIEFVKDRLKRVSDYEEFGIKLKKDGSLSSLCSNDVYLLTKLKSLDEQFE